MGRGCYKIVVLLVVAFIAAGCGPRYYEMKESERYHTVRRGDTLFSISWRHGLDYRKVATWNGLRSPYTIYPGQRIQLFSSPTAAAAPAAQPSTATAPQRQVQLPPPSGIAWQWPTDGQVVRQFSATASGTRGISISGKADQPVKAASGGDVVYSGSGLIGYGNLLIIKHDDRYLSAYGHNSRLLVGEGDKVKPGQVIARMGTVKDQALLHFEIRIDGRPVDPLTQLPKR